MTPLEPCTATCQAPDCRRKELACSRKAGADLSGRGVVCHRHGGRLHARGCGGAAQLDWRRRQRTVVSGQGGRVQTVQALRAAGRLQARVLGTLGCYLHACFAPLHKTTVVQAQADHHMTLRADQIGNDSAWPVDHISCDVQSNASTVRPLHSWLAEVDQQHPLPSQATNIPVEPGKATHSTEALPGQALHQAPSPQTHHHSTGLHSIWAAKPHRQRQVSPWASPKAAAHAVGQQCSHSAIPWHSCQAMVPS